MRKDVREVLAALGWASGIIGIALAATAARRMGMIDQEAVTRLVIGLNGLLVAWYGNRMPKAFVPSLAARRVARVGGWSMVLSGLAYAALWAFAPVDTAIVAGCAAIIAGIGITVAFALSLRTRVRKA